MCAKKIWDKERDAYVKETGYRYLQHRSQKISVKSL
jgi:hypothetical protein